MKYIEKEIKRKYVFKGKVFNARKDSVELINKKAASREIIEHSGGACGIAINEKNEIYMVRQYRYATGEELLEIPAGKLEKNELPLECIRREFKEEIGITTNEIKYLGDFFPSPGISNEKIYIYYTNNFKEGPNNLDENEFLDVEKIKLDKIIEMIKNNSIKDMKTVVAILRYLMIYKP